MLWLASFKHNGLLVPRRAFISSPLSLLETAAKRFFADRGVAGPRERLVEMAHEVGDEASKGILENV